MPLETSTPTFEPLLLRESAFGAVPITRSAATEPLGVRMTLGRKPAFSIRPTAAAEVSPETVGTLAVSRKKMMGTASAGRAMSAARPTHRAIEPLCCSNRGRNPGGEVRVADRVVPGVDSGRRTPKAVTCPGGGGPSVPYGPARWDPWSAAVVPTGVLSRSRVGTS